MGDALMRGDHKSTGFVEDLHLTSSFSRMPTPASTLLNNNNNLSYNNNTSKNHNNNNMPTSKMTLSTSSARTVKTCSGCGEEILDRYLLHALERYWHTNCLKCSCCNAHLGEIGSSCFTKNGLILCKNDYIRLFGSGGSCSSCGQTIPASEFVMKVQGNVYHQKCFTCVTCHCQLMPGDRYSILNGSLLCEQDYPKVLKGHAHLPSRPAHKPIKDDSDLLYGPILSFEFEDFTPFKWQQAFLYL